MDGDPNLPFSTDAEMRFSNSFRQANHTLSNTPLVAQFYQPDQGFWNDVHNIREDLSTEAFRHVVSRSPKCINSLISLLRQLQQGHFDHEWLISIISPRDSKHHVDTTPSVFGSSNVSRNTSVISRKPHWSCETLPVTPVVNLNHWFQAEPQPMSGESLQPENYFDPFIYIPEHGKQVSAQEINIYPPTMPLASNTVLKSPFQVQDSVRPEAEVMCITNRWMVNNLPNQPLPPDDVGFPHQDTLQTMASPSSFRDKHPYYNDLPQAQEVLEHVHSLPDSAKSPTGTALREAPNVSYQTPRTPKGHLSSDFNHYSGPQPTLYSSRSPCPYCQKEFVSPSEFSKHITAEHDKPIEYICRHRLSSRRGKRCDFRNWSQPIYARHHTEAHEACKEYKLDSSAPLISRTCLRRLYKPRPRRIWGCWFCDWPASRDVDAWAKHHVEQHRGCNKKDMNKTWLMKSLLSQEPLRDLWQQWIQGSEEITSRWFNAERSIDSIDVALDKLITQLETGYWTDHDYFANPGAREGIMNAVIGSILSKVQPNQK